jgi:flagellar biosynthesis anti-sigma factor FlgM
MRIDSNQGAPALPDSPRAGSQASVAANASTLAATSGGAALGEDQAQVTGIHVQVQALVAQAVQLPETSQSKVSALRQAVLGGSYNPSPENVAGALFDSLVSNRAA